MLFQLAHARGVWFTIVDWRGKVLDISQDIYTIHPCKSKFLCEIEDSADARRTGGKIVTCLMNLDDINGARQCLLCESDKILSESLLEHTQAVTPGNIL